MFSKIKEHILEFIIVVIVLSGILYSTTTAYKTSVKVDNAVSIIKNNEEKIKELSKNIAVRELKNGTLTEEDIKALMSDNEFQEFKMKINAMDN